MKIILIAILLLFLLNSCMQTDAGKNITDQEVEKEYVPVIIDTLGVELLPFETYGKERIHSSYLYFGPRKDTIIVCGEFKGEKLSPCEIVIDGLWKLNAENGGFYSLECEFWNPYKKWTENDVLKIMVDTSAYISKPLSHYTTEVCKGFAVIIENASEIDSIDIGYGFYLPIVIQAKDSSGKWESVEERQNYGCGYQLANVILPPSYIAISSVYVYDGDFQTELRLKLGGNYSNTFTGKINYSQFENNGKSYFYSPPPPAPLESK